MTQPFMEVTWTYKWPIKYLIGHPNLAKKQHIVSVKCDLEAKKIYVTGEVGLQNLEKEN